MSVLGVPEGGEHPGPVIGCPLGPPNDTIGRSVGTRRSSAFRTTRWHGSWQLHYTQSSSISRDSVRHQIQVCWYLCWYEVFKPQHTVSIMRKQINLSPGPLVVIDGRRFEFLNPVPSESGDSGLHVSRRCDAATSPSVQWANAMVALLSGQLPLVGRLDSASSACGRLLAHQR